MAIVVTYLRIADFLAVSVLIEKKIKPRGIFAD